MTKAEETLTTKVKGAAGGAVVSAGEILSYGFAQVSE